MFTKFQGYRENRKIKRSAIWGKRTAVLLLVLLTASWSVAQSSKMSKDLLAVPSGTTVNVVVQYSKSPTSTDVNTAKGVGASNGKAVGLVKGYRWTMSQGNVPSLISKDSNIKYVPGYCPERQHHQSSGA